MQRVILHYAEWQNGHHELGEKVEFREVLLQNGDYASDLRPKLLIVDDLMRESSSSGTIVD